MVTKQIHESVLLLAEPSVPPSEKSEEQDSTAITAGDKNDPKMSLLSPKELAVQEMVLHDHTTHGEAHSSSPSGLRHH